MKKWTAMFTYGITIRWSLDILVPSSRDTILQETCSLLPEVLCRQSTPSKCFEYQCISRMWNGIQNVSSINVSVECEMELKKIQDKINDNLGNTFLNLGSCGLHTLHNAFRDGMKWNTRNFWNHFIASSRRGSSWKTLQKSLHHCHQTPVVPKEVVSSQTGRKCCSYWHALLIMPHVIEYVAAIRVKKVSHPQNNSRVECRLKMRQGFYHRREAPVFPLSLLLA